MNNNTETQQSAIQLATSRFGNFLYWFIHNEIATPIFVILIIVFVFALAPFYIVVNYFYRYYIGSKTKITPNYLQVGQKFIGKLRNEHNGKVVTITERMLDDDEHTLMFLHYYGFEEMKNS